MLVVGYIQFVEKARWLSPIVVVPKNNGKLIFYIDFRKLNATTKKDPYPLPFTNEVLNTIVGYETYSFLDGYLGYHQNSITLKEKYNIAFVIEWGAFIWKVMSFGIKNGPPTYKRVVTKAFRKCLDNFMKIFLDDFTMYSDMDNHL